ncbi:MAG: sterol desaturase family protein [Bacteroidetes bacterium]|jgi:sterol desaturase/sphingolipid hydroxylase (fatty acid hydroxylase superfamily)|nr:sterol desaturase family protein [Bacteroidota bacterium]
MFEFFADIFGPLVDIYARELRRPIPNPLIFGVPFFVLFIFVEILFVHRPKRGYRLYNMKDMLGSMGMGAGAILVESFTSTVRLMLFGYLFLLADPLRATLFGYHTIGGGQGLLDLSWAQYWWVWALVIIADDFNFYWHHRFSHTVRVLWAAHIVHHSSEHFNLGSTAIRNGWATILYKPLFWLWMPLVGFHPVAIITALAVNAIYQYFLHIKWMPSWGFVGRWILNSPWLHQIHHSCNVEYMDKNHSGMFIIWDRLFGTYKEHLPRLEPRFGVTHPPASYNPLVIFGHEYAHIWQDVRRAPSLHAAFMYIFGPPGWSHDGSSMTAKQLNEALENKTLRLSDLPPTLQDHFREFHPDLAAAQASEPNKPYKHAVADLTAA